MKKIIKLGLGVLLLSCMITGCKRTNQTTEETTTSNPTEQTTQVPSQEQPTVFPGVDIDADPTEIDSVILESMASAIVDNLSLEEKLGQMFLVNIELLDPADPKDYRYREITETMESNIDKYKVGGVIQFARNIKTRKQITEFNQNLQEASQIPLFVSVDEEGGSVSRIGNNEKMETTKFPAMAEIGEQEDPDKAFEVGDTIGREIKELGFNLDFAPVADVNTNPDSPEIGNRSFSSDPDVVAQMVVKVVEGLQGRGVSATLKHFPGHGGAGEDTHKGYANIEQTIKELRQVEFVPFDAGIKNGVDLIMVSHLAINNVTGETIPASLSSLIIKDILRNELGFKNLIITDALNMKAITSVYSSEEAAVAAVNAGADILLMPENLEKAYEGLYNAVQEKKISESRIDQSVTRIIKTKLLRGVIPLDTPLLTDQSTKTAE